MSRYLSVGRSGFGSLFCLTLILLVGCSSTPSIRSSADKTTWQQITPYYFSGDYTTGISMAEAYLVKHPEGDAGLWYWLGRTYAANGQGDKAIAAYQHTDDFAEEYDWRAFAQLEIGHMQWQGQAADENLAAAAPYYRKSHEIYPVFADATVWLAADFLRRGLYDEARHYANWFIQRYSSDDCCSSKEDTASLKRRAEVTIAFVELAVGDVSVGLSQLEALNNPPLLAMAYWALGDDKAYQLYTQAHSYVGMELGTDSDHRVSIVTVSAGQPAQQAGLQKGDIILSMNGSTVSDATELVSQIVQLPAFSEADFHILRGEQEMTIPVITTSVGDLVDTRSYLITAMVKKRDLKKHVAELLETGDKQQAFAAYLDYLQRAEGALEDEKLVQQIIDLARQQLLPPLVSEAARKEALKAQAVWRSLGPEDNLDVVIEGFQNALRQAPWWADAWYNLALAEEANGDPVRARRHLQYFMQAAPNDPSLPQVRDKIYLLEVAEEQQRRFPWAGLWQWNSYELFPPDAWGQEDWRRRINADTRWQLSASGHVYGSLVRIRVINNKLTATLVRPSAKLADDGAYRGQIIFEGRVEDGVFQGHATEIPWESSTRACFGDAFQRNMSAQVDSASGKISARTDLVIFYRLKERYDHSFCDLYQNGAKGHRDDVLVPLP